MPDSTDVRKAITTLLELAGVRPTDADLDRLEQFFALGSGPGKLPSPGTEPALVHLVEEWPRDE